MGKNKKKSNYNYKNKNSKKEKDNYLSEDMLKRQKIRKEKHIWLWLIFFMPVGLYKAFKYKAFNKWILYIGLSIFSLFVVLSVDLILNPYRVIDLEMKKVVNENDKLGEYRRGEIVGNLDNKYIIYNVVTTNGIYDIYVSKNHTVNAIKGISPNREIILENNFEIKNKDIHAEILRFFNINDNSEKYGEIKGIEESDTNSQTIKTTNGVFKFNIEYEQVVQIEEKEDNGAYKVVYNKEPIINLPKDIQKLMKKREKKLGKIKKVVSYKVNEKYIEYVVQMDNSNLYKIQIANDNTITIYNSDKNN